MASLKFQKSALTVSFLAALLSLSVATQAQAVNDSGELLIEGQISTASCVLQLGDPQSTGAGKKTMNLGTYTATAASAVAAGAVFGTAQSIVLGLKNADGNPCSSAGGLLRWDVGINISPINYETAGTFTILKSTAASGNAATGVGVKISTTANALVGLTPVNFASGNGSYGTLLNPAAVVPTLLNTDTIALTAQMARTSGVPGVGVFTHSIPLNVWYK
jgi:hypothetical protein